MKKFSKVLSLLIVLVMCLSLFSASAFAGDVMLGGSSAAVADAVMLTDGAPELIVDTPSVIELTVDPDEVETPAAPAAPSLEGSEDEAPEAPAVEAPVLYASAPAAEPVLIEEDIPLLDTPYDGKTAAEKAAIVDSSWAYFLKSAPADVNMAGWIDADTFKYFEYTKTPAHSGAATLTQDVNYTITGPNSSNGTMTILSSWLVTLPNGTYYFWGITRDDSPVRLGWINVATGTFGPYTVTPSTHKYKDGNSITVSDLTGAGFTKFAVTPEGSSSVSALSPADYTFAGGTLTLRADYLDKLADGDYVIYGFMDGGGAGIKLGSFTTYSGEVVGDYTLSPGYQKWNSTDDPLVFYSSMHADAERGAKVLPDVRYGINGGPFTSVRLEQYWDLGNGYFMLGRKFLESLSADELYSMQIIDAIRPNENFSNIVTFSVGPTLRAIDTDKHVINSTRSLRFRCSSPISRVYVGNIELTDPADFGISWDGRIVTLSFEFLNKRSAGNTYNIKVLTTGGDYASTTFQILTTAQGSASPRTGDESNLGLWAAFMLLSGTAVVVLVPKLRKHDI